MTLGRVEHGVTEAGKEVWILPRGTPVLAGLDRLFAWITHTTNDGESPQGVVVADEIASRAPSRPKPDAKPQTCTARESYLRVSEVAARLGLCQETVRRLIRVGTLQGTKLDGMRNWRVSESSLARYLGTDMAEVFTEEPAGARHVEDNVQSARARFRKLRDTGRPA